MIDPADHIVPLSELGGGIRRLATKGMDKGYRELSEITSRLRGRVEVVASYRRMTHASGRMVCEFDELTADTLPNQILKATCRRLVASGEQLTPENRVEMRHCVDLLSDINDVAISSRSFRRFQLHRNNRHYRLLLHVCQLLHELCLPDEQSGQRRFRRLLDEETVMHQLFEKFVKQFAVQHCRDAKVSFVWIKWVGEWDEKADQVLPTMRTDVTLERPHRKTILDCKFYKQALVTQYNKLRLHSGHLYQLSAYLQNKSHDPGWSGVNGILLYPAVAHQIDLSFELLGHGIEIRSIDLDRPWPEIDRRLLSILA